MTQMKVALIGAGTMAARHAQVVANSGSAVIAVVFDRDAAGAGTLAAEYGAAVSVSIDALSHCDVAIIATATPAHHEAAAALVAAGIPVLVEKPLTASMSETRSLIAAADMLDGALMCGFNERFNERFVELRERQRSTPDYVTALRTSNRPRSVHSSVIDDVLIHDLDLVLALLSGDKVESIHATAADWDAAHSWPHSVVCELTFSGGTIVHLEASRVAAQRRRVLSTTTGTDRVSIDLDDAPGDSLRAQWQRFVALIDHGTPAERQDERDQILRVHELAESVRLAAFGTP